MSHLIHTIPSVLDTTAIFILIYNEETEAWGNLGSIENSMLREVIYILQFGEFVLCCIWQDFFITFTGRDRTIQAKYLSAYQDGLWEGLRWSGVLETPLYYELTFWLLDREGIPGQEVRAGAWGSYSPTVTGGFQHSNY